MTPNRNSNTSKNMVVRNKSTQFVTKRQVRSMIDGEPERKVYNSVINGSTVTAGVVTYVFPIDQGTNLGQRVGDRVTLHEITWDIGMLDSSNSLTRFILFSDTMINGGGPAVTDVISSANYYSQLTLVAKQQGRYKILYDDVLTTSTGGNASLHKGGTIKLRRKINFSGTGSTSASSGKNALFALVLGNNTTVTYDWAFQFVYTDD